MKGKKGFQKGNKEAKKKGKNKKTIEKERAQELFDREILKKWPELLGVLNELALEKKDMKAIVEILNRILGKPKENLDITSGGKPIPLLNNVYNNNSDKKDSDTPKKD